MIIRLLRKTLHMSLVILIMNLYKSIKVSIKILYF